MNRKGITTIELLICFVIVIVITMSMYSVVSSYNERRITESYKAEIITYKNTITKDIQDDLIKIGITGATYERTMTKADDSDLPVKAVYTVNMDLRDGTKRQLVVEQTLSQSSYHPAGNPNVNDQFMIKYGDPNALTEYPLPELGSYEDETTHKTIQDFSINNVLINIYDEKVLSIYIGFYHPELGTRYCIEITALIDFTFTGAEFVDPLSEHFFIVYNLFGGTVTPPNRTSFDRRTDTFTLTNPRKAYNTFTGWSGTGISGKTSSITIAKGSSGSRTYNANWEPNICNITYSPNGGVFGDHATDTSQTCEYHATNNCTDDMRNASGGYYSATRTGYSIASGKEWISSVGETTFNQANGYKTVDFCPNLASGTQNVTLSVNWVAHTYSINYNTDGGTNGSSAPTSARYDNVFQVSNPTKNITINFSLGTSGATASSTTTMSNNYTFTGWNVSSGLNASTALYGSTSGSVTKSLSSSTLKVTDQYFKNLTAAAGGSVTMNANWASPSFQFPTLSKTNWTCHWSAVGTANIPSGGTYKPNDVGGPTSITFTAECDPNFFNITYNKNSTGTVSNLPANGTKWAGDTYTIPTTVPTLSGYGFAGWNTQANGTGNGFPPGGTYRTDANVTFFAQWSAVTHDVVHCSYTTEDSCKTSCSNSCSCVKWRCKQDANGCWNRSYYCCAANCYVSGGGCAYQDLGGGSNCSNATDVFNGTTYDCVSTGREICEAWPGHRWHEEYKKCCNDG